MPNLLISGSAGSGKSAEAARELAASTEPGVILEIQEIYAALLGIRRDPETGRYPERLERDAHALRLAEYLRRVAITAAVARGLRVITSNSDSDLERRALLLRELGPGAVERIVTVDYDVAISNLQGPDGTTSEQCRRAVERWHKRGRSGPATL